MATKGGNFASLNILELLSQGVGQKNTNGPMSTDKIKELLETISSSSSQSPASTGPASAQSAVGTNAVSAFGNAITAAVFGPAAMIGLSAMGKNPTQSVFSQLAQAVFGKGKGQAEEDTAAIALDAFDQAQVDNALEAFDNAIAENQAIGEDGQGSAGESGGGVSSEGSNAEGNGGDGANAGGGSSAGAGFAMGGKIPGYDPASKDTETIRASKGEYVLRNKVVDILGSDFLDKLSDALDPPTVMTMARKGK